MGLLGFLSGIVIGATGAAAWLASQPAGASTSDLAPKRRLSELRKTLDSAIAEGKAAGARAETGKRLEFEALTRRRA